MKLVHKGKVKDVYEMDENTYLLHFSDRISAFDVEMPTPVPRKGEVLCQFAKFWFDRLDINNHMISTCSSKKMVVKKLNMIPFEFIVRGYFYGSIIERQTKRPSVYPELRRFEPVIASRLPKPLFDPTTKSDKHDMPITEDQILRTGTLSRKELSYIKKISINLYQQMGAIVGRAGFIIADTKFEFGFDLTDKSILLADSLGPDEFRLWRRSDYVPGKVQESYDKQLLRDWLINSGFKDIIDEHSRRGLKPVAPNLPSELVSQLSYRYIYAYEQISRARLGSIC